MEYITWETSALGLGDTRGDSTQGHRSGRWGRGGPWGLALIPAATLVVGDGHECTAAHLYPLLRHAVGWGRQGSRWEVSKCMCKRMACR